MKRAAVLAILLLAGCDLYWNHGDDDDVVCSGGGEAGGGGAPEYQQRDPSSGNCVYVDDYGDGGCSYDENGCCVAVPVSEPAMPVEPYCTGACEGLDENTCDTTSGCHAEYVTVSPPAGVPAGLAFVQCWDIEPLAPIEGSCLGLDANTCAQYDDCVSVMSGIPGYDDEGNYDENGTFQNCEAIPGGTIDSCDGVDCGSGASCEQQCYPCDPSDPTNGSAGSCMNSCGPVCVPNQTCDSVDCGSGYECAEACDASSGVCGPACYPTGPGDPGACTGAVTCNSAPPTCPTNTVPGITDGCYSGFCIPTSQCGPDNPGSCDATGVMCNIAAPSCPMGTVPGVSNGCWSGFCIPDSQCPPAACPTLTNAMTCEGRADCTPVFNGSGCTCDSDGTCSCTSESFAHCETIDSGSSPGSGASM